MPTWLNLASKIHQNPWKIDAKRPSQVELLFKMIFDGFLVPTSTSRTFKIIVFPIEKQGSSKKSSFEVGIDFWCHLDANLPPFSFQNQPKSHKHQVPRGIQKLINFGFDFLSIWAPFWEPSWNHVAHQNAPKTPQDAPKTPYETFKTPPRHQDALKRPQDASKTAQDPPKTAENRPRECPRASWGPNKLARRYQGAAFYNPPPYGVGVWDPRTRSSNPSVYPLPDSSSQRFLSSPS